jgi:hypothetical protein
MNFMIPSPRLTSIDGGQPVDVSQHGRPGDRPHDVAVIDADFFRMDC